MSSAGGLQGLNPQMADRLRAEGLERHRSSFPLRRHAAERKDLGLGQYMKQYLSEQDYNRWKQMQKSIDS